jgi:hypothetical protein
MSSEEVTLRKVHSLRPSPALIVSILALVTAIAGTSWAVGDSGAGTASKLRRNAPKPKDYSIAVTTPVTSTATIRRTVPTGKTFLLSDVILQNPASDTGRIEVRRGSSRLLKLQLQKFSTEQHSLNTPIKFRGGQKLTLFIDCDNPSGGCTPAALFVGVLKG